MGRGARHTGGKPHEYFDLTGMGKLLLLFVIVPAAELALLIQAGIYLGTWPTLALIVFTGIVGAYLARRQGLSVLTRAVLPPLSVGEMTLRLYAALNYSQNSAHDLRRALNGA